MFDFSFEKIPPFQGLLNGVGREREGFYKRFNEEIDVRKRNNRIIKLSMR